MMMIMIRVTKKTICYHLNNKMRTKSCLNFKIMTQKMKKTKKKLKIYRLLLVKMTKLMRVLKMKTTMKRSQSRKIKTMMRTRMKN